MAVQEIPKSYLYTCDACGATHTQEHAYGHYTDSTPPNWSKLFLCVRDHECLCRFRHDRLLCAQCTDNASTVLRAAGIIPEEKSS